MKAGNANKQGASRRQSSAKPVRLLPALRRVSLVLLAVVVVGSAAWGSSELYRWMDKPVALIAVKGDFKYASKEQIASLVGTQLDGGFLSLDLQRIREELERDPWIESAAVARSWPDELVITVSEETPIARWNRDGFLNRRGEALEVLDNSVLQQLPLLLGPQGEARRVMEEYRHAAQMLLPVGLKTMEFRLDKRNAWHLKVAVEQSDTELEIEVGQGGVTEKIRRFLAVYKRVLRDREADIEHIDIRYPNGVAVRWSKSLSLVQQGKQDLTDRPARRGQEETHG